PRRRAPPTDVRALPLHDALPISLSSAAMHRRHRYHACPFALEEKGSAIAFLLVRPHPTSPHAFVAFRRSRPPQSAHHLPTTNHQDRKSTRLNSSHVKNSYAVFCL